MHSNQKQTTLILNSQLSFPYIQTTVTWFKFKTFFTSDYESCDFLLYYFWKFSIFSVIVWWNYPFFFANFDKIRDFIVRPFDKNCDYFLHLFDEICWFFLLDFLTKFPIICSNFLRKFTIFYRSFDEIRDFNLLSFDEIRDFFQVIGEINDFIQQLLHGIRLSILWYFSEIQHFISRSFDGNRHLIPRSLMKLANNLLHLFDKNSYAFKKFFLFFFPRSYNTIHE